MLEDTNSLDGAHISVESKAAHNQEILNKYQIGLMC